MMKKRLSFSLLWLAASLALHAQTSEGLQLHYTFSQTTGTTVTDDTGNGYNGTLLGGASVQAEGGIHTLKLGTSNGYLDMGTSTGTLINSLGDFTVATYLYIDPNITITGAGNFAWVFSTSTACGQSTGKYVAYRVNQQRYAQSSGGWSNERVGIAVGSAADKGSWQHVVYTQSGTSGRLYINGTLKASGTASLKPSDLGEATAYNWLGRPQFSSDSYLRGASYADFRIYNRSLAVAELAEFTEQLNVLNYAYDSLAVEEAKNLLTLSGLDQVKKNLTLPTSAGDNVKVTWVSSHPEVLSTTGLVARPAIGAEVATVTLTATLTRGNSTSAKEFTAQIIPHVSDQGAVEADANGLGINTNRAYFLGKIPLTHVGGEGSAITWRSSNTDYLTDAGDVIKLPAKGDGEEHVTFTATLTKGEATLSKELTIRIHEDEGYAGYLWAYFLGNSANTQENIWFALSNDGFNFKRLNSGNCVIKADTISDKRGVRDPHILRGPDNNFYMVVTDMMSSQGWSSNHGIVLMKSDDLVTWTHSRVDVKAKFSNFSNINRAWAPQTYYDEAEGKYMVYFSMKSSATDSYDIIYYAYANEDFTDLESEPKVLYDDGYSTIDGDIIYRNGIYNLFFKTEDASDKGYKKAVSPNLTGPYTLIDKYLDQSSDAVEGACVYKLNNQEKYVLIYDLYTTGNYEFTVSDSLDNFRTVVANVTRDFAPRHGTILGITAEEAERLAQKWGTTSMILFGTAQSTAVKQTNIVTSGSNIMLPVKYGTDLTAFDPMLTGTVPGVTVSPVGPQDFTQGAVTYTLSLNGASRSYNVTAAVHNNPVITGYYADPEILYSEKTGKYYIYPTSDGFEGWGGYYFKVFSSTDLVHWSDEGVFIDMHDANQISWANGNAWAPSIIEKKINGEYKYVFYFSGGLDGGSKRLGYAVADHPTGPFTVSSTPLITSSPTGSGQQIDSDVFTDPVSGKTYLYWGNGYLAVAELSDDLTSLVEGTTKTLTPSANYTEAVHVFYREGRYYFMWSYGNTGNADYRVYYGYSSSPTGPLTIPANNNILVKNTTLGINGPGHNSVIQIPGTDEWYMVYHRISRPNGINSTTPSPGNVRETCIDKLEFNADGTIKAVVPTLEGIAPLGSIDTRIEELPLGQRNQQVVESAVVKEELRFTLDASQPISVTVVALSGKALLQKELPTGAASINCPQLPKGVYTLLVKAGAASYVNKIIKI